MLSVVVLCFMKQDSSFMQRAISLAERAKTKNEIPVGAVLVHSDKIISTGWNQSIRLSDPTAHAEVVALRKAGRKLNNYRLVDLTLYVTLEPCIMCVGAIIHARIKRVVFGAFDPKTGSLCSKIKFFDLFKMNHVPIITSGVLENQCSQQISSFFKNKRLTKR